MLLLNKALLPNLMVCVCGGGGGGGDHICCEATPYCSRYSNSVTLLLKGIQWNSLLSLLFYNYIIRDVREIRCLFFL